MAKRYIPSGELFNIIQGVIAVILLVTLATLLILGRQVPTELWALVSAVVGFFLGGISANNQANIKEAVISRKEGC